MITNLNTVDYVGNASSQSVSLATTKDQNIYVNGSTGSDTDGNGSASRPFATIPRAFRDLPYEIKHKINIRIAAGSYSSFPCAPEHNVTGNGQFVMEGLGTPIVIAGPFTTTGVTDKGSNRGIDLAVSGAGWTPDSFAEKFIRFTNTAGLQDRILPIHKNNADTIETISTNPCALPTVGTTFNIIEPSVKINISDDTTWFRFKSSGIRRGTNVIFANLAFENITTGLCAFQWGGDANTLMGLVSFKTNAMWTAAFQMFGGGINDLNFMEWDSSQLVSPQLVANTTTGMWFSPWPSLQILSAYTNVLLVVGSSQGNGLNGQSVLGCVSLRSPVYALGNSEIYHAAMSNVIIDHRGRLGVLNSRFSAIGTVSKSLRIDDLSKAEIQDVYFDACNGDAISIESGSIALLENVAAITASIPGYGIKLEKGCKAIIADTSTPTGSSGAIHFTQSATTVAYPGSPGRVTDGFGSEVIQ